MAVYRETVLIIPSCPRCGVDVSKFASECDFCGLALGKEQPDTREPILTRIKRRGQIASQRKEWRAF